MSSPGRRRAPSSRFLDGLRALSVRRHRLIGLAVLRVVLGLAALEFYLTEYARRGLLWGPDGYVPLTLFRDTVPLAATSAYAWNGSLLWFEAVHHLGVLVAAAFCVFGGRVLTVLHLLLLWSVHLRNGHLLDHGHLLTRLLLVFLAFTTCDAYLSPNARRRRARLRAGPGRAGAAAAAHNCAVFLMVFQICVVHFTGGLWKLLDPSWRDGTALYDAVSAAALGAPPWAAVLLSYGTVAAELAVPFAAVSRRRSVRRAACAVLVVAHLALVPFAGLLNFGLVMIAGAALLLRDTDHHAGRVRAELTLPDALRRPDVPAGHRTLRAFRPPPVLPPPRGRTWPVIPSGTMEPCPDASPRAARPAPPPVLPVPRTRRPPAPAGSPPPTGTAADASTAAGPRRPPPRP